TSYEWRGQYPPKGRYWAFSKENMQQMENEGRIVYSKTGVPRYKIYADEGKGRTLQDLWTDIAPVHHKGKERLGYPTQKPLALMERILEASTNKDSIVLDAFCGCGTTVAAAEKLGRRWIGIDITFRAIDLIQKRLTEHYYGNSEVEFKKRVEVFGIPKDVESAVHLAQHTDKLRKEFEKWACTIALDGVAQEKKGADGGMDGFIPYKDGEGKTRQCLIQVKSGKVGLQDVQRFNSVLDYFKADIGVFFTIQAPTKPVKDYLAQLTPYRPKWGAQELDAVPRIQLITVEQHFQGERPVIPGKFRLE
ncbi:MAG: hypothetical protein QOI63_1450, partial [Thermoplasmata archaeon]|nr:hypothetical protein [Thermoplasmata archaeon]